MDKMKDMPYKIGITLRIFPSYKQKDIIAINDGASRFIYNKLVARGKEIHNLKQVTIYCQPIHDRLDYLYSLGTTPKELKAAYPFLADERIDAQCIANAVKNYNTSWKNYRERPEMGSPTFHKKGYEQQYQTNAHYGANAKYINDGNVHLLDKNHIQLPKLGGIRFACSDWMADIFQRTNETRIGSIKIWRNNIGEYYATLQVGSVEPFHKALPKTGTSVGIDVNIENLYTDSDGNIVPNPKFKKNRQKTLSKHQKKLSRKYESAKKRKAPLRDAKNYQKQRLKTAKTQLRISRQREEYIQIISKNIVKSHDNIYVEKLNVKNMMKNHHLAYSISDCAWGTFAGKLEYKAALYGKNFSRVPAKNTTQTCSACGYILKDNQKLTLDVREWECPHCHKFHSRDHNAAINILHKGLRLSA